MERIKALPLTPEKLEDERKNPPKKLKKINLGEDKEERVTLITEGLAKDFEKDLISLLKEYQDTFAWSYKDMPGLSTRLITHKLAIDLTFKLIKQVARNFSSIIQLQIKKEIEKLLDARFIKPCMHSVWLANVVPVRKKNGQIRVCVDFRDLNKACPKDDFPLPNLDMLIETTANHEMFSFMDGFSGYNQIKMDPQDAEMTAFRTPFSNFYHIVMPFGFKNAGATYQRAMTVIFMI